MLRRPLTALLATLALAAVLVPVAGALDVRVRVEGATTTIYGKREPLLPAPGTNALVALEVASLYGEFHYHVTVTSFGPYVDRIGRYGAGGTSGWVFKVNGVSPPVGADAVQLKEGDRVLWYWATFGPTGGPPTLDLVRSGRKGCYQVTKQDDVGARTVAADATLHVDGRRIRVDARGVACPGPHKGLVRATAPDAVRSQALR